MLHSSFSKFLSKTDELIMDRFIPSNASQGAYRSRQTNSSTQQNRKRPLRDESLLNMNNIAAREGAATLSQWTQAEQHDSGDSIAQALNVNQKDRVFTFTPNRNNRYSPSKYGGNCSSTDTSMNESYSNATSSMNSPILSMQSFAESSNGAPSRPSLDSDLSTVFSAKYSPNCHKRRKQNNIKINTAYKILAAPDLGNDFYSNLISWSKSTGNVAIGLGGNVHLWNEDNGDYFMLDLPQGKVISCVSFSDGELLTVAFKDGAIKLLSQKPTTNEDISSDELTLVHATAYGICCIKWFPGSQSRFFAGDESGNLLYFEVENHKKLKLIKRIKCHQQQVCGIAISNDMKEMAIGGNDNCCSVWNIDKIKDPVLKYCLPHQAAVKAIAYCPWSKSLLATGGGTKDKTIRFWHTNSGTLLNSYKTMGQITSLTWSKHKRQIAATFGFGDNDRPIFISIFSYPTLEVLQEVEATQNLRALSAVLSPDSSSICVASNDDTVRFYGIWDPKDLMILDAHENNVFGSEIIELHEGIATYSDLLR